VGGEGDDDDDGRDEVKESIWRKRTSTTLFLYFSCLFREDNRPPHKKQT
jgi:hypothetical protein